MRTNEESNEKLEALVITYKLDQDNGEIISSTHPDIGEIWIGDQIYMCTDLREWFRSRPIWETVNVVKIKSEWKTFVLKLQNWEKEYTWKDLFNSPKYPKSQLINTASSKNILKTISNIKELTWDTLSLLYNEMPIPSQESLISSEEKYWSHEAALTYYDAFICNRLIKESEFRIRKNNKIEKYDLQEKYWSKLEGIRKKIREYVGEKKNDCKTANLKERQSILDWIITDITPLIEEMEKYWPVILPRLSDWPAPYQFFYKLAMELSEIMIPEDIESISSVLAS